MDDFAEYFHEAAVGGGRLSLIDLGDGPAVLLGHGYLWDWSLWEPQIPVLARGRRLLIPDMWGHGRSGPLPPDTRSLVDIADHMLGVLDARGIDRCVVVGLSLGGMWGAHLAAMAPDRVAGLVMLNSYLGAESPPKRAALGAMLDRVEAAGRFDDEIARLLIPLFFAPGAGQAHPELVERLRQTLDGYTADTLRASIAPLGRLIIDRPDDLETLTRISAPTLIIGGAQDLARPAEESRIMADIMDAELAVIGDCGHTAALERPAAVSTLVEGFLDRLGWSAGPECAALTAKDGR
ncbi:MAG: alpha/beta hydrolase [Caulobacter sp.]